MFEEMQGTGDLTSMCQIALGGCHSLFLEMTNVNEKGSSIGKLFACGCGAAVGLLSENDDSIVPVPRVIQDTKVFNSQRVVDICAGMFHNVVLLEDGSLVCWGVGANGRLGDDKSRNVPHPQVLKATSDAEKDNASIGQFRGFALKQSGQITVTESSKGGEDFEVHLQDPSEGSYSVADVLLAIRHRTQGSGQNDPWAIKQLGAGSAHTVALTTGGNLYVWGSNDKEQLGVGRDAQVDFEWAPRKLTITLGNSTRLVKEVAVGYEHCIIVTNSADLWAWGKGQQGQLGTGRARTEAEPVLIQALQNYYVLSCAAGDEHSGAIVKRNKVGNATELFMWGSTENGMLGLGPDQPANKQVPQLVTLQGKKVASGKKKAKSGSGNGVSVRKMEEDKDAVIAHMPLRVTCGQNHTAVITGSLDHLDKPYFWDDPEEMCRLWTFGGGWYGKLGLCNTDNYYVPTMVGVGRTGIAGQNRSALLNVSVKVVSCGTYHTCMVGKFGDLYMWGRDRWVNEPEHQLMPKKSTSIETQHKIANVVCGENHSFVILETGEVWVWGENKFGQLGLNRRTDANSGPEQAKYSPGVINQNLMGSLATGPTHTVGLFANGEVWGWGNQSCGRLGLEEKDQQKLVLEPKRVQAVWRSVESMSSAVQARQHKKVGHGQKDVEEAEKNFIKGALDTLTKEQGKNQVVKDFATMQTLIKTEEKECREKVLAKHEKDLGDKLQRLEESIKKLPDMELALQKVSSEFQQSVEKNLKYFKLPPPKIDDSWSDDRFVGCLPYYREVLRALQAQPCYIAVILANLRELKFQDEQEVVYSVIEGLYKDIRTHKTLLMLMRHMVVKELEPSGQVLFNLFRTESNVFQLFTRYALSPVHIKDVVWLYLKDDRSKSDDKDKQPTLYARLTSSDMYVNTFAKSFEDYMARKSKDAEYRRDAILDQEAYQKEAEKFRDWLMGPFVQAVKVRLPDDIRAFLGFVHKQCLQRKLELGDQFQKMDGAISQELNTFTPVLRLFVQGILVPILRDLKDFVGPPCYLPRRQVTDLQQNEEIIENASAVADFLESMLDDKFDAKSQKDLKEAARTVRPELLRFVEEQVNNSKDTLQSELVIDTFLANYDMDPHTVSLEMGTLMLLTNTLKDHAEKMSLRDKDELVYYVGMIDRWDEETLEQVLSNPEDNRKYNFKMEHRFLLKPSEKPVICRSCKCPMPERYGTRNSTPGMISKLVSEEDKNPRKALEAILRELPFSVKASTFDMMRREFEEKYRHYKFNLGDIPTSNQLQEGLRVIDDLANVQAYAEDVLKYMTANLINRSRHREYLDQLEFGSKKIAKIQDEYEKSLRARIQEMVLALDFSIDLVLPAKFLEAAKGVATLEFAHKAELLKQKQPVNPKEMPAGCVYSPIVTLKMVDMRKKEILKEIHRPFTHMERKMEATFETLKSGGVQITIGIAQTGSRGIMRTLCCMKHAGAGSRNIVAQMVVDANTLATYQRMDQEASVDLGEPAFLTVFACRFHSFVTVDLSKKVAFR